MKIYLSKIYSELEAWRNERKITAKSQKEGYIINVMEEFGELSAALRLFEKSKSVNDSHELKCAEHFIIDAICDIAVLTINAGADSNYKPQTLDTNEKDEIITRDANSSLKRLLSNCGEFNIYSCYCGGDLLDILTGCAKICEIYGFNFEIAMLETIKEISSRTGSYNEATKKWIKESSDEARAKWYQANYELARIKQ